MDQSKENRFMKEMIVRLSDILSEANNTNKLCYEILNRFFGPEPSEIMEGIKEETKHGDKRLVEDVVERILKSIKEIQKSVERIDKIL